MLQPFLKHFSQNSLLLEYSESFITKLATRLAAGDAGQIETIKGYIRFFDTIRNRNDFQAYVRDNPNLFQRAGKAITDIKNVDMFNATQLEQIYDAFNAERKIEKEKEGVQQPITKDADLMFPDDVTKTIRQVNPTAVADDRYLEIYRGGDQPTCVKFSHDVFGQSYEFCIGRRQNNMYTNYRFQGHTGESNGPRTFYFVRDYSRPMTDDMHLIVVHALQNGNFKYTDAPNTNGDKFVGSWENLVAEQPKLKNHKEIFQFIPFTETEEDLNALQNADGSTFNTLTPRQRNAFLQGGKHLPIHFFTQLSSADQSIYIQSQMQHNGIVKLSKYGGGYLRPEMFNVVKNTYKNLTKILNTHTEWGLSNISQFKAKKIAADIFHTSSFINTLKLLKFNTKYYFDAEGNAVPRNEERLQPLRYFINHVLNDRLITTKSEDIESILKIGYSSYQSMVSLSKLRFSEAGHDSDNSSCSIIKCKDKNILLFQDNTIEGSEYSSNNKITPTMVMLDSVFNITSKPAHILSTSKYGFYVHDEVKSAPYLVSITTEGEVKTRDNIDPNKIAEADNYAGKYSLEEFSKFTPEMQKIQFVKRLQFLAQKLSTLNATQLTQWGAPSFNCIIGKDERDYRGIGDDETGLVILNKRSDDKISPAVLRTFKQRGYDSPVPEAVSQAAVTYDFCEKYGYTDYFMEYIQPYVLVVVRHAIERDYGANGGLSENNMLFLYSGRGFTAATTDLNNYKIINGGAILLVTKSSIIIGEGNAPKNFNNIFGINKETFEEMPEEDLKKVKDTLTRMTKLKENEAADVIATTCVNYQINPAFALNLSKKTNAKSTFTHKKMPPYVAKAQGKALNTNTIFINTQGNETLQSKYLKFITHSASGPLFGNSFSAVLKVLSIFGIELSAVLFTPTKHWQGGVAYVIGYLFAKEGIDLKQKDLSNSCDSNSFYMEAKDVYTVMSGNFGKRTSIIDSKGNFFTDTTEDVRNALKAKRIKLFVRPNIKGNIRSKGIVLDQFVANILSFNRYTPSYFNQIVKTDPLVNDDVMKMIIDHLKKAGFFKSVTPTRPVQEAVKHDLPFSLYYKVMDSIYD